MYTDMISIKCPNCGGHIEREENEFFARCPYCGVEVGFDELSEEAGIEGLRDEVDSLRSREREDGNRRRQLSRWIRVRNIILAIIGGLNFLGFLLIGFAIDVQPRRDVPMGFGVIFCILAWLGTLAAPVVLGIRYPGYDLVSRKRERGGRLKAFAKILLICLALLFLSAFAAYMILKLTVGV